MGYGDGYWVTYKYDHAGRMTEIYEQGQFLMLAYYYDELGRRTTLGRANNGAHTYYAYGDTPWLTAMTHDLNGTAYDLSTNYTNNAAGQIVQKQSSNEAYAWAQNYNVSRGYQVNGLNQYTQSGSTALGYDGRGNLNTAPTPNTGGNGNTSGSVGYTYTADNALVHADVGGQSKDFNYDTLGRLSIDAAGNRLFGYAGSQLLLEKDYNGNTVERYVYGQDEAPLVRYDGQGYGTRRWLYADERGSVIAAADDGGNAQTLNKYDEFGIPASGNDGRFGYTGQAWNTTLKMWNYKARTYSPTLGRFLQSDPIGYGDGLNWYNYVGGDPVNGTDPSGTVNQTSLDIIVTGGQLPSLLAEAFATAFQVQNLRELFSKLSGVVVGFGGRTATQSMTPACGRALTAAANMSAVVGLPFDGSNSIALQALGTGSPASIRITDAGMRIANQYVRNNPGLLSGGTAYGPGLTAYQINFGAAAYGGSVNGPGSGGLGALLGRATVVLNSGGNVVGIRDTFDYDPSNASFPMNVGMAAANAQISAACGNRVSSVPVTGGVVH